MSRLLVRRVVLCAVVGSVSAPAQDAAAEQAAPLPNGAPEAMAHIDRGDLREHAFFLASDELGGRYTGSEGQEQAAEYIAKHFEELGLAPLGDKERGGRGYFQGFPVERTYLEPARTSIQFGQSNNQGGFAVVAGKSGKKLDLSGTFVFCGT